MMFVAGLALALAGDAKATGKTHEVTAEVVAINMEAHTITIKAGAGESKTVPVKEEAVEQLKTVAAGDKVVLTCHDNDKGEHEAVVKIKKA
jgi:hypothetical protein